MRKFLVLSVLALSCFSIFAQENILSKDGRFALDRKQFIFSCLRSLHKDRTDKTALAICECRADKLTRRFTTQQYKKHTEMGVTDLDGLLKEDTMVMKDMRDCFTNSGKTVLLQAEGFESEFVSFCEKSIRNATEKSLDSSKVRNFCICQLQMVKSRKLTDEEVRLLENPNSLLFYEMMYKCGDPFATSEGAGRDWSGTSAADVKGADADTISTLTLNGMTYVKVKIGSTVQVWLFDTGASDLLINNEMEETLKKENIINAGNYLGTVEYELANGMVDTCRRYRINNVQIGGFTVDNVLISVTDKGKRIIIGKSLLNKFRNWVLDNERNRLILFK